tara:strand:- start:39571 stop:41019 length:1449 start_codon:yes stop_codon:yes gene_type:complete
MIINFFSLIKRSTYIFLIIFLMISSSNSYQSKNIKPNIILIMTDDQGWGQTGYYNHPILKTPNIDSMAKNGLRFDRFYAGAPLCSPTRATVLTGRSNDRTGVFSHGYALRLQERTIAQVLKKEGYATGHFGKWHLNGLKGPGVPIFEDDSHGPKNFGFDYWLTVSNFFDLNPIMSRNGVFENFKGTSSEIIVDEAINYIKKCIADKKPFFTVLWDGSPHDPFIAIEKDRRLFNGLDEQSKNHFGELVAFDRSLGRLRDQIKKLGIAENTILWFCSDNGGLRKVNEANIGGLKETKGSIWEGGIRVPGIIEWKGIIEPRITSFPASTLDIFPTILDILDLPKKLMQAPIDGISLFPIFNNEIKNRKKMIPFKIKDKGALIDNNIKLVAISLKNQEFELYDIESDPSESENISIKKPSVFKKMKKEFNVWYKSVQKSVNGQDYPEGKLFKQPSSHFWMNDNKYKPFIKEWIKRPEYKDRILKGK